MAWNAAIAIGLPFYDHLGGAAGSSKAFISGDVARALSNSPYRVSGHVTRFGGLLYEQMSMAYVWDGLRPSWAPRIVVLPGAPGLMVQGCEQAAFSIEHQRWRPELPAPEPLAPVPLDEILAQLKGEGMAANIAALRGKFKNGAVARLAMVPVSFIL